MNDDNERCIMMNIDVNVDDLKDYVGTSKYIILSRRVSSLTMSNFDAYRHILKKLQSWPNSLLTMWGQCMKFVVDELEVL